MALRTQVKINHVTNLSDARYCAGMGVHMLGFCFDDKNENYVKPDMFKEISGWVSGPEFAGEFENREADYIKTTLGKTNIDIIETTRPELLNELAVLDRPLILKLDLGRYGSINEIENDMSYARDLVDYFLLESQSDSPVDLDMIFRLAVTYRIILSHFINKQNINQILDNTTIEGIALYGEQESKTGLKDYDHLADILEKIEVEDAEQ